jgi:hypothetical protein
MVMMMMRRSFLMHIPEQQQDKREKYGIVLSSWIALLLASGFGSGLRNLF